MYVYKDKVQIVRNEKQYLRIFSEAGIKHLNRIEICTGSKFHNEVVFIFQK